jgi:O-methyltransferase involved in polyketide biosynthesis
MATKFSIDTPQLADLVRGRTLSCDMALLEFSRHHDRFLVVNVGCGYDSRPWRMKDLGGAMFVELDLPVMLRDRQLVLPAIDESPYKIMRHEFDILKDNLENTLVKIKAPRDIPMFVVWEGGSMYFAKEQADPFLLHIRRLMCPKSQVWLDFVSYAAVNDLTGEIEVQAFIDNMRMIGEPFVRGIERLDELSDRGFDVAECISAAVLLNNTDPAMKHYSFATCVPSSASSLPF